jgi:hypothetical protein
MVITRGPTRQSTPTSNQQRRLGSSALRAPAAGNFQSLATGLHGNIVPILVE